MTYLRWCGDGLASKGKEDRTFWSAAALRSAQTSCSEPISLTPYFEQCRSHVHQVSLFMKEGVNVAATRVMPASKAFL